MGVLDSEYQRMHDLKKRVLEPALEQINEHTDITASYEQHKKGRVITGFSFKFKEEAQTSRNCHRNAKTATNDLDTIKPYGASDRKIQHDSVQIRQYFRLKVTSPTINLCQLDRKYPRSLKRQMSKQQNEFSQH